MDLGRRSPWITQVGRKYRHKCLDHTEEEKLCVDGGRGWRDAATSQGAPRATRNWKQQEGSSLSLGRTLRSQTFGLQNERIICVALSHHVCSDVLLSRKEGNEYRGVEDEDEDRVIIMTVVVMLMVVI